MKRIIFIAIISFSASILYAQKDSTFYKHEVRVSVGDAIAANIFLFRSGTGFANFSLGYFYRPVKWFWVGGNFIHYFGDKLYYNWREYDINGNYNDFSKSKIKYGAVIAPEVRFSYLNKKVIILYGALSGGVGLENGFDTKYYKYPQINYYFHITYFGFSGNFGKNSNIFLGAELGAGMRGFGSIHGGYRF